MPNGKKQQRLLDALEFEAFKALTGADYVRQRLLHALSMGAPSVEAEAYLLKSRVKDVGTLVAKVLDRQAKRPTYRPSDARDIVGLRLLTLFKSELPKLLNTFLTFVQWSQQAPFSLFFGHTVAECVEEIQIYPVSDPLDPNLGFFLEEFALFGFFPKDAKPESVNTPVLVDTKKSRYSSIHIVLWANGPTQTRGDRVPVEVQLRTSLEDVWGEIEHRFRYKPSNVRRGRRARAVAKGYINELEGMNPELEILKKSLDAASDTADLIQRRVATKTEDVSEIRQQKTNISKDITKLYSVGLPNAVQQRLDDTVRSLLTLYQEIYALNSAPSEEFLRNALVVFDRGIEEFGELLKEYKRHGSDQAADEERIEYHLRMEKALCFYWKSIVVRSSVPGIDIIEADRVATAALHQALSQYHLVRRMVGFERDPVVSFRTANAISADGEHEYALLKYREAYSDLDADTRLSVRHHMRILIPRYYALALWHSAERMKWRSAKLGDVALFQSRRQEHYLEAVNVSMGIYGQNIDEIDLDGLAISSDDEDRVTANNIVEYVVDYLLSGGDPETLSTLGLNVDIFRELMRRIIGNGIGEIRRMSFADTVRKAARILGEREIAVNAAERTLELLVAKDFVIGLPDASYEEARWDAEQEIAQGLKPVVGYPLQW